MRDWLVDSLPLGILFVVFIFVIVGISVGAKRSNKIKDEFRVFGHLRPQLVDDQVWRSEKGYSLVVVEGDKVLIFELKPLDIKAEAEKGNGK